MSGAGVARRWYRDNPLVCEYATWLAGYGMKTYVTLTYRDGYWDSRPGFSSGRRISRATVVKDFEWFLRSAGYHGRYFISVEDTDRNIPHIHGVLDTLNWSALVKAWFSTRGYAKVLPITDGCESYVAKYVLKDDDCSGIAFRLEKR